MIMLLLLVKHGLIELGILLIRCGLVLEDFFFSHIPKVEREREREGGNVTIIFISGFNHVDLTCLWQKGA